MNRNKQTGKYDIPNPDYLEFTAILHAQCSNHCAFCIQQQVSPIYTDELLKVIEQRDLQKMETTANAAVEFFNSEDAQKIGNVDFKVMGGELWDDSLSEKMEQAYYKFFETCINGAKDAGIKLRTTIITNLLYSDASLHRMLKLIQFIIDIGGNVAIGTSFDVWGRFHSKERLQLWRGHFDELKDFAQNHKLTLNAELVLTRSAVRVLQEKDPAYAEELENFNYLYELMQSGQVNFGLIRFHAVEKVANETLNDREFAEFHKWLARNYPAFENIQRFIHKMPSPCAGGYAGVTPFHNEAERPICLLYTARDAIGIHPELSPEDAIKAHTMCSNNEAEATDFSFVFNSFIKWNHCELCPHFKYCQFDCMEFWNTKSTHENPDSHYCWLRDVYDYIAKE